MDPAGEHTSSAADETPMWEEPVRGFYTDPGLFAALSGLELQRTYFDGRQLGPPVRYLFGLTYTDAEPGSATFTMPASPWLSPPHGVIQGAAIALLVDGPLGCAIHTELSAATPYTTSEMSLSFVRPVLPDGSLLTATARAIHVGRTVGLSEAPVIDKGGNLVALTSCRCVILPRVDLPEELGRRALEDPPHPVEPAWPTPHPHLRSVQGTIQPQEVFDRVGGLEFLQGCIAGEVAWPPIRHLTGIRPTDVAEGSASWAMPATEWLCSPVQGRLYGGAIAYLAGNAADTALMTTCDAGTALAPVDLKVYFLRPGIPDGRDLTAKRRVIHRGRSRDRDRGGHRRRRQAAGHGDLVIDDPARPPRDRGPPRGQPGLEAQLRRRTTWNSDARPRAPSPPISDSATSGRRSAAVLGSIVLGALTGQYVLGGTPAQGSGIGGETAALSV